ncbi:MAG: hypothetical protein AAGF32_07060, partial [Pseudomonadota bacterium]
MSKFDSVKSGDDTQTDDGTGSPDDGRANERGTARALAQRLGQASAVRSAAAAPLAKAPDNPAQTGRSSQSASVTGDTESAPSLPMSIVASPPAGEDAPPSADDAPKSAQELGAQSESSSPHQATPAEAQQPDAPASKASLATAPQDIAPHVLSAVRVALRETAIGQHARDGQDLDFDFSVKPAGATAATSTPPAASPGSTRPEAGAADPESIAHAQPVKTGPKTKR